MGSAALLFAIVLAIAGGAFVTAALVLGTLALLWEGYLFYRAGL